MCVRMKLSVSWIKALEFLHFQLKFHVLSFLYSQESRKEICGCMVLLEFFGNRIQWVFRRHLKAKKTFQVRKIKDLNQKME